MTSPAYPVDNLTLTPMSELDAVNVMLMSIGQAPVNTLNVPGIKDVSFAKLTLHNTSRNVQARGWWFNRETEYPLAVQAGTNEVLVPVNTLALDCVDRSRDLVERAGKLYDKDRHSYSFAGEAPIKADITWFIAFAELPQVARNYIATRAARLFQANFIGSRELYAFTKEEEDMALAEMMRIDLRTSKPNILAAPVRTNMIHRRR